MGHRPVTVLGSPDHCMRRYSLRPSRAARSRVSGVVLWPECDIARSRMDVRFRGKSGRAADITGTTEFDPNRSWLCENSSARRARRNISKKLRTMESNRAARTMFDTLLENCIFYISQLYEFSRRLGQTPSCR